MQLSSVTRYKHSTILCNWWGFYSLATNRRMIRASDQVNSEWKQWKLIERVLPVLSCRISHVHCTCCVPMKIGRKSSLKETNILEWPSKHFLCFFFVCKLRRKPQVNTWITIKMEEKCLELCRSDSAEEIQNFDFLFGVSSVDFGCRLERHCFN